MSDHRVSLFIMRSQPINYLDQPLISNTSDFSMLDSESSNRRRMYRFYTSLLIMGLAACSSRPQNPTNSIDSVSNAPHPKPQAQTPTGVQKTPSSSTPSDHRFTASSESSTSKPLNSPKPILSSKNLPAPMSSEDIRTRLAGPQGVKRWEPSGIVHADEGLWVVSDRGGWLARYQLPLIHGVNRPIEAHQLKPDLKHRVKWEGLAWERDQHNEPTALLLLEAISRSVWRCEQPHQGCPELLQQPLSFLNPRLDQSIPTPFKYVMFEALAYHHDILVGVRGYQDTSRGLIPWSLLVSPKAQVHLDTRVALNLDDKRYGVSGASYDHLHKGYWITWSYEDEDGSTQKAVGGILSFVPLKKAQPKSFHRAQTESLDLKTINLPAPHQNSFMVCARFHLKPEGVTVNAAGNIFVVFDEDLDRKQGDVTPQEVSVIQQQRFALHDFEDFIWNSSRQHLMGHCVSPSLLQSLK